MLHGDEVGALLGEQVAAAHAGGARRVLACSIVSSRLLARIAAAHGLRAPLDADRLQVDLPGGRPGLRLRGGARLLRATRRTSATRTACRAALLLAQLAARAQGRRAHAGRPARRPRAPARPAPDRPALRALRRPRPDPRDHGPGAQRAAGDARRLAGGRGGRPGAARRRGAALPPTDGLRLLAADGTRVVDPAQRHRAQGQVLPRGDRAGRRARRRRDGGRGRAAPPARRLDAVRTDLTALALSPRACPVPARSA